MIKGVPYDAELEYIESTGTQWIDTLCRATYQYKFECRMIALRAGNYAIYGASNGGDYQSGEVAGFINSNISSFEFVYPHSNTSSGIDYPNPPFVANQLYDIQYSRLGKFVNGVEYASQWTFAQYIASRNIYVFAINRGSANKHPISMRLFYFRIYDGYALVRDFIPVRKGTVGYMYDRVTRKLFGNQGTGDFVRGPDKAYPVMSIHRYPSPSGGTALGKMGAGQRMMRSFSAKDYVQDGLVAMWDGIENAGWGVHDPNATVWKDLVGTNDFSNFKTGVVINDNYIQIPAVRDAAVASSAYPISQVSTIEGVQSLSGWDGLVLASFGSNLSTSSRWLGFRANGTFNFGHGLECADWGATANTPFSVSGTVQKSSVWSLYKNGAICQGIGAGMNWGNAGPFTASINKIAVDYTGSKIYCIRLYSRALTAAEIAHNYEIDKIRFNLP